MIADVDAGGPAPQRESPDLWHLPEVRDLKVRRRRFDPPRRVTSRGVDRLVDGKTLYRFFAFQPEALQPGAPIALAWNSPGAPRRATSVRFPATPGR